MWLVTYKESPITSFSSKQDPCQVLSNTCRKICFLAIVQFCATRISNVYEDEISSCALIAHIVLNNVFIPWQQKFFLWRSGCIDMPSIKRLSNIACRCNWIRILTTYIYCVYMVSFALSRYHIWITSGLVLNVICWVSVLNEPMRWPPGQEDVSLWSVRGLVRAVLG